MIKRQGKAIAIARPVMGSGFIASRCPGMTWEEPPLLSFPTEFSEERESTLGHGQMG
jgi:hypothetical protein